MKKPKHLGNSHNKLIDQVDSHKLSDEGIIIAFIAIGESFFKSFFKSVFVIFRIWKPKK